MARTNKSMNKKAQWREVAGPYGMQIRISEDGELEIRGRIRSGAELDAMMAKLRTAVQVEYEFQRSREGAAPAVADSDAEQIALFEKAAADWPRIPVLGDSERGREPAALLGQSGKRSRGGPDARVSGVGQRMSA